MCAVVMIHMKLFVQIASGSQSGQNTFLHIITSSGVEFELYMHEITNV